MWEFFPRILDVENTIEYIDIVGISVLININSINTSLIGEGRNIVK